MEIFARYRIYFRLAPIWLWPHVWLQLARIRRYTAQTGRKVLFTFTPQWKMKIKYIADAPGAHDRLYQYTPPASPAWQRPATSSDLPDFLRALTPRLPMQIAQEIRGAAVAPDIAILVPP